MSVDATMIRFSCDGCGRPFAAPSGYVGRKATCKTCGVRVVVPPESSVHALSDEAAMPTADSTAAMPSRTRVPVISEAQSSPVATRVADGPSERMSSRAKAIHPLRDRPPAPAAPAQPKIPMRTRRLMVDAEQAAAAFAGQGPIRIKSTVGDPPELYQVEYHLTGLQRGWLGKPKKRQSHLVEIQLTSEYPRLSPKCRMLTPVFHPNIDETTVCVGDHWTAGERLVDLIVRIGQMLAYQDYNIKSPLNGEAAMWADLHPTKLPVDPRDLNISV